MTSGFNIFYQASGTWYLLASRFKVHDEPTQTINGTTEVSINLPAAQYSAMTTFTKALVGGSTAIYICYTAPGVTASTMNSSFDSTNKFFLGRVTSVQHQKNEVIIKAREIASKWLTEPITESSNIEETVYITSFVDKTSEIQCVTTQYGATSPGWSTNVHAQRGARIAAAQTHDVVAQVASFSDITTNAPHYTNGASPAAFTDGDLATLAYGAYDYVDTDTSPVSYTTTFKFHVDRDLPDKVRLDVYMRALLRAPALYSTKYSNPLFYIHNFTTSGDELVYTPSAYDDSNGNAIDMTFSFSTNCIRDYLDYDAFTGSSCLQFKAVSGCFSHSIYYRAYNSWDEWTITISGKSQHAIVELPIVSNTANTLTLDVDSGTYDTFTNRLNVGDPVQILYNEKEWTQSYLPTDSKINSVTWNPTTINPTYYLFDYMTLGQYLTDVTRRDNAYWRASRATTTGSINVSIEAKTSPPSEGLLIDPTNIDLDSAPVVIYNSLDKCREVIVKNKDSRAIWPTSAATSDLPAIVLNCPQLPDSYLLSYATSVYNARNAISDNITVDIKTIQVVTTGSAGVEDFESYAISSSLTGQGYWKADVNNSGTVVTGKYGQWATGGTGYATNFWEFPAGKSSGWNVLSFKAKTSTHMSFIPCQLDNSGGYIATYSVFFNNDGYFYAFEPSLTRLGVYNTDTWYWFKVHFNNALQGFWFEISTNGTSYTQYGSNSSYYGYIGSYNIEKWEVFAYYQWGSSPTGTMDNLQCDWWTSGGGTTVYNVRDAPDSVFFAGAACSASLAPTTVTGSDYQVTGSFPIRGIKWLNNERATLYLGYAEAVATSPDVLLENILLRHDYNATS